MTLKLYVDRTSQPSRAVLIFCNKDYDLVYVLETNTSYDACLIAAINPFGQVPSIADGDFKLFESHAILSYLACAYPGVADHWYPSDLQKRAKINSVLDWHHSNLRRGGVGYVIQTILGPVIGKPTSPEAAAETEQILISSLSKIESVWLNEDGDFLLGNKEPSIADLSLVCEITEFEILHEKDRIRILTPFKKVLKWIEDTRIATSPHFEEVHKAILASKASLLKLPVDENYETGSSIKAMLHSPFCLHTVLGPLLGIPTSAEAAAEAGKILTTSLSQIESVWLNENGKFLLGNSEPSIADLSLVCEIMQFEILLEEDRVRVLTPFKKVLKWIEDTRIATSPHFEEVHKVLLGAKSALHKLPLEDNYESMSSIKAMLQ